ncbi:MAG: VOC family protein, partial [bacterium]|nr:VOC family protein [bacterium]
MMEDADRLRDFYSKVVGWKPQPVSMGDYDDYNMTSPATGAPAAGVCHKRGGNADLPSQWIVYVIVADLDRSLASVRELGGRILAGPKSMGGQERY